MEQLIETIDIRTTDSWGANWDEMETARDFIQNFFDANETDEIKIEITGKTVKISGPAEFDHKALIYLWSNKGADPESIGQYGEGFKVSVLNALRNWNCGIEFYVGSHKLRFYFKNIEIASEEARAIICEHYEVDPIRGSCLVVSNCPKKLIGEFEFGLKHFYYANNPLLGRMLLESRFDGITIYESSVENTGYVFYKKLMRKVISLPLIIVANKEIRTVENKIKHDRDRKAFDDGVLEDCLRNTFKKFDAYELKPVVYAIEKFWPKGHPILNIMASYHRSRSSYKISFPENYYALEHYWQNDTPANIAINDLTREIADEFKDKEYICCPRYMSALGMKTPDDEADKRMQKKRETINKTYSREMTMNESQGISILANFIKIFSPELYSKFENAKYTVGENEEIIGELKKQRAYNQHKVFLNKTFFTEWFNDALAILLHEWAHIYGYDGSRSFSDALTFFISLILKNEAIISNIKDYEKQWNAIVEKIKQERKEVEDINVNEIVKNLSNEQLINILCSIPQEELYKLLDKYKFI